jgi:predicted RNA binding protein YcfA (HicA-like mRNA interferase family)
LAEGGRKLRHVRAPQAIRAFERLGYVVLRTKGSHYILRHPTRGLLVLPFHRGAIKTGIIMDALKKARLSVEEFEEYL